MGLFEKIFGTHSEREIKKIIPKVEQILAKEQEYAALTDEELKAKTAYFKEQLAQGKTLDDLLVDAFATIREASWRVIGLKHYRVQLIGGIILHQGRIAEMKTGEGKTLVATAPLYLNALLGKGAHLVTVNDYLAETQSKLMGRVFNFLGLKVGLIVHGLSNAQRREAYASDITYGTNNEFGFDYLRDNMVTYVDDRVQRPLHYAIVDEVDSILIDEARTPLIISGHGSEPTHLYGEVNRFVLSLEAFVMQETDDKLEQEEYAGSADYIVDEKAKTAVLTQKGVAKAEAFFRIENLADEQNFDLQHYINNALKAHGTMHLNDQYIVQDDEIVIVDDFTGRLMYGRRYSDGLHQAIEAKEGVEIKRESKTLATITFQNFFRMYKKLSGMTGTAQTEEDEFRSIYSLDVVCIPTNRAVQRIDMPDSVYKTIQAKNKAIVETVQKAYQQGQPVLIGTVSVEKSEQLSKLFKKAGIPHEVLNAKHHQREAEIVAQAGRQGAVTIATNMAGRGTDILLGGNPEFLAKQELRKQGFDSDLVEQSSTTHDTENVALLDLRQRYQTLYKELKKTTDLAHEQVVALGGLLIIGTERHESRRIDNQLRGRSGRQGDPGRSKFYLALEDDLLRLFGGEQMSKLFDMISADEDLELESRMLSKRIESAQKKVEGKNFGIRKNVLEFDDVMNKQRETIYAQRSRVLEGENLETRYHKMIGESITAILQEYAHQNEEIVEWNAPAFVATLVDQFGALPEILALLEDLHTKRFDGESLYDYLYEACLKHYKERELSHFGNPDIMREVERIILLRIVDQKWMDHIDNMDALRNAIGMRGYAQHDPVMEYKKEGLEMFKEMTEEIQKQVVSIMMRANFRPEQALQREESPQNLQEKKEEAPSVLRASENNEASEEAEPAKRDEDKVGRNEPCPCGSGKKYKNCHGQ